MPERCLIAVLVGIVSEAAARTNRFWLYRSPSIR
jgi:hypothetical protein